MVIVMSCRPHARPTAATAYKEHSHICLLPQMTGASDDCDVGFDYRPPALPTAESPLRTLKMCVVTAMCIVGVWATLSATAEPLMRHGRQLVDGVQHVVQDAIDNANVAATHRVEQQQAARQSYVRRLGARARQRDADVNVRRYAMLRRMAALQTNSPAADQLNADAVVQHFPTWAGPAVTNPSSEWDADAVLRDLAIAVSLLSERVLDDEAVADG